MTSVILDPRRIQQAAWAVFMIFLLNGFNFASWASRIPAVRDTLEFSEARMGVLLLAMAVGSMCALPLSGMIMQRLGARNTIVVFAVVNTCGFLFAAVAVGVESALLLRIALFVGGVGTGVWDAAMNLEGAAVEQKLGRTIMPRLHAGFSFGTIIGAGVGALMTWVAVPFQWHITGSFVVSFAAVLVTVKWFLPREMVPEQREQAQFATGAATAQRDAEANPGRDSAGRAAFGAWLEPRTLMIGLIVLAAALTEGAANDWVSLSVIDGFQTENYMGAVGLTVFLTSMTAMRMWGTGLLDKYGRVHVLRLASVLAFVGLAVFALVPNLWIALLGVIAWGMGAALGFPVGMSAASDDPKRAAARVSVVSTIGYSAFFMGPPLIGLLAEHVGYRHALLVILAPIALGLLLTNQAKPLPVERSNVEV